MPVRFRWPTKPDCEVALLPTLNILGHAQLDEIDLGSQCGGHGVCGKDRVKITSSTSKLSPVTEAEHEHLSPEELSQGYRLACQCFCDPTEAEEPIITVDMAVSPTYSKG